MARVLGSSFAVGRTHRLNSSAFSQLSHRRHDVLRHWSLVSYACKASPKESAFWPKHANESLKQGCARWIHSISTRFAAANDGRLIEQTEDPSKLVCGGGLAKVKRKKLKGKRAVVKWLKFFRWKKKKEFERMTTEEKILYKLNKAQKKEERLVESLKKLEPSHSSETMHDPEILTPEEHFYFLKMGIKCKNYVPVGRRGIYQGVILNMHLHWKKHQTLKVVVKTFTPEEVKEIAAELARLTGGIVLAIHEGDTIIMYRGKNYVQPPTEIMSPRVTLSRKKALDKSKCMDGLRAVRKHIPRLKQELELLRAKAERKAEKGIDILDTNANPHALTPSSRTISSLQVQSSVQVKEGEEQDIDFDVEDSNIETDVESDSEELSDCFETDSEGEVGIKTQKPLFLEEFDRFPSDNDGDYEDLEEHLRNISAGSRNHVATSGKLDSSTNFDEVDRMFLRAASLLKKRRR